MERPVEAIDKILDRSPVVLVDIPLWDVNSLLCKYHDILNGLSPVTKHDNWAGSPANTADSNSKGLIRGGTVNIF